MVLANREYEAWFLAVAPSLAGHRGLALDLAPTRANASSFDRLCREVGRLPADC